MSDYNNMADRIMIKSDDSVVLRELKQRTKFKLVYEVDENRVTIPDSIIKEIKEVADTVTLRRTLVFSTSGLIAMPCIQLSEVARLNPI
jgi:hypothetical protein